MSCYWILKIQNELSETVQNEALPSFVHFQTTSFVFSISNNNECKILFITLLYNSAVHRSIDLFSPSCVLEVL